ncbi:PTS sugar transporter subunit IIC, partial [Escherichia coli]|nr:PTS sugar transporter subunit IIC [Escherichia coli]
LNAIKELDGVIGVVEAETLQIILGTGVVNQVSSAFEQLLNASDSYDLNNEAQKNKQAISQKNRTPFKLFLRRIASIFIPII